MRIWIAARMVVRNDDRRCIEPQRLLDQLARIHRCAVDGAAEHLGVFDQAMLCIEDVWLINATFSEFAEMIPDLKSLTPAQRLTRDIKSLVKPT